MTTSVSAGPAATFRTHGYFFRQAAMLTIAIGVLLHLSRVVLGDDLALRYVVTPAADRVLLIPMTYAAVTGILVWPRVRFANTAHRVFFTVSVVYIAASVPLHVYCSYVRGDVAFLVQMFPIWFSYLLFGFYAALLTMFWRLKYKD